MGTSATKAKNKYNESNYDRINLIVPKGKRGHQKPCRRTERKLKWFY